MMTATKIFKVNWTVCSFVMDRTSSATEIRRHWCHFECNASLRNPLGDYGPCTLPIWKTVASILGSDNSGTQTTFRCWMLIWRIRITCMMQLRKSANLCSCKYCKVMLCNVCFSEGFKKDARLAYWNDLWWYVSLQHWLSWLGRWIIWPGGELLQRYRENC